MTNDNNKQLNTDKFKISIWGIIGIGLTTVIGSGIWRDPLTWINDSGSLALLAIIISWLFFFTAGLAYSECVSMFPNSGGPYSFVSGAINKTWGTILGILYYLGYIIIGALLAFLAVNYGLSAIEVDSFPLLVILTTLLIIIFAFVSEYIPLKIIGNITLIWVIIKILSLIVISIILMVKGNPSNLSANSFNFTNFTNVGNASLWALMGFEVMLVFSGDLTNKKEIDDNRTQLPKGIISVLVVILITYIIVTVGNGFIANIGYVGDTAEFEYIEQTTGISKNLLAGLTSFSSLGTCLAMFVVLTHQLKVMAKGGSLPDFMGQEKRGFYWNNSIITAILSGVIGFIMTFCIPLTDGAIIDVLVTIGLGLVLLSAMIPAGIIALYLRIKMPILERPFKTPVYFIIFPLSIILSIYLFILNILSLI